MKKRIGLGGYSTLRDEELISEREDKMTNRHEFEKYSGQSKLVYSTYKVKLEENI